MVATITPMTLADLRRKGEKVMLIDVRTPAEFGEVHVDFARNMPLDRIDPKEVESLVGCGLVFAGITDTCGMAILIAKMPWNRACRSAKSCCSRAVLFWLVLGGLVLGSLCGTALAEHTRDSLDVVRQAVAEQKAVMIDVREPAEWQEGHLTGAGLLPLSVLEKGVDPQKLASVLPKDKIIYCYCLAGGRCAEAAALLKPLGYDVRALKPGYPQLVKAGFPAMVGK